MTIYVHDIAKLFLIYIFFDLKSYGENDGIFTIWFCI